MVYIDKGEAQITAGEKVFTLSQGEAYFHKPGEWHNIVSNKTAPSVVIISFECKSGAMSFFCDRKLNVGQKQKELRSLQIASIRRSIWFSAISFRGENRTFAARLSL